MPEYVNQDATTDWLFKLGNLSEPGFTRMLNLLGAGVLNVDEVRERIGLEPSTAPHIEFTVTSEEEPGDEHVHERLQRIAATAQQVNRCK